MSVNDIMANTSMLHELNTEHKAEALMTEKPSYRMRRTAVSIIHNQLYLSRLRIHKKYAPVFTGTKRYCSIVVIFILYRMKWTTIKTVYM